MEALMRAKCASVGGLNEESRMAIRIGLGVVVCGGNGHPGCGICTSSTCDKHPWTRARRGAAVLRKVMSWSMALECQMISDLKF